MDTASGSEPRSRALDNTKCPLLAPRRSARTATTFQRHRYDNWQGGIEAGNVPTPVQDGPASFAGVCPAKERATLLQRAALRARI